MNRQLLELYNLDPAGEIPESELQALARGLPAGAAEAICPTLKICPTITIKCTLDLISCTTVTFGCYCPTPTPPIVE